MTDPTAALDRLAAGGELTTAEISALLQSRDLIVLGMLAETVRKRQYGTRVTFLRVLDVPFDLGPPSIDNVPACGVWRISGEPPSVDRLAACVRSVAAAAGDIPVSGSSLGALADLGRREDRPLTAVLATLREAGLTRVADGGIDGSDDPVEGFAAAREAGVSVERATVADLVDDWQATAERLRRVADAYGAPLRFAPLPRSPKAAVATGYDDVRQVALARLMLPQSSSIQVDWTLHGPKLAQVALLFGADDIDVVVTPDDPALGLRRGQLLDVRRSIEAAHLDAVERKGREEFVEA